MVIFDVFDLSVILRKKLVLFLDYSDIYSIAFSFVKKKKQVNFKWKRLQNNEMCVE